MQNYFNNPMLLNLQLFGDGGGDGGTGADGTTGVTPTAAGSGKPGVKSNPLADVKYGIQEEEPTAPAAEVTTQAKDRAAEFDALIKGEYKDLYDQRVQEIVQKRLKSSKEAADRYTALTPMLELLAKKYGVDATDAEALVKAIEDDDAYFEEEALERGIPVDQLRTIRKLERDNETLRREKEDRESRAQADQLYSRWIDQATATQKVYPSFNFEAELQNPQFVQLLKSNIDVRTAYEVIHKDQIIAGAMQFTAQETERRVTENIRARGQRPVENGNSGQGAATTKSQVSQLTKADRAEIARRVARGERIRF